MNKIIYSLFLLIIFSSLTNKAFSQPLKLENVGSENVYFTYHNKPLLSFGSMSDFIFYASEDAYNYKLWADWQSAHGMNHCRAYIPGSWKHIEKFAKENDGSLNNILFPYKEFEPGSRIFDLTQFDERYWKRFREQCEYLQSKEIIIDLLMLNGWQFFNYNKEVASYNWDGHFFNPQNNINKCTELLNSTVNDENRLNFYHSFSDGNIDLFEIQKKYYEKVIEVTHDLDNIYYELVHELGMNYGEWEKVAVWLEEIAKIVRKKWKEYNPDRKIILATDGGHLRGFPFNQSGGFPQENSEMDWIFSRQYFDVIISGNHHHTGNIREWTKKYKKPYIAQESNDNGQRWTYRRPETRTHLRKYVWKLMMAKCQQIDIYSKPITSLPYIEDLKGPQHNYDPNNWNKFENDALILRQFFDNIIDYGNLKFQGYFFIASTGHNMVLSSPKEIIAYISSPTGLENIVYPAPRGAMVWLYDLLFEEGEYKAQFFDPKSGPTKSKIITIKDGTTIFRTPEFVDDFVVHIVHI